MLWTTVKQRHCIYRLAFLSSVAWPALNFYLRLFFYWKLVWGEFDSIIATLILYKSQKALIMRSKHCSLLGGKKKKEREGKGAFCHSKMRFIKLIREPDSNMYRGRSLDLCSCYTLYVLEASLKNKCIFPLPIKSLPPFGLCPLRNHDKYVCTPSSTAQFKTCRAV